MLPKCPFLLALVFTVAAACSAGRSVPRPAPSAAPATTVTTVPVTAPSTVPATTTPSAPAPARAAPAAKARPLSDCAAALAYLESHMAPGWRAVCPGYALGHQAATCWDIPGLCPGMANKVVIIAVVCPASVLNEAHNTWIFYDQGYYATGPWDGYGVC